MKSECANVTRELGGDIHSARLRHYVIYFYEFGFCSLDAF